MKSKQTTEDSQAIRIGVISSGPDEFTTIHSACAEFGHQPVVYIYGRSLRPQGPNLSDAGETLAAILPAVPQGMDLLLPGSMEGLALALTAYQVDLLIVFGFGWKLPSSILAIPRLGALNIHVSMLPQYRGPAPLLWAIRNGDATGGVTIHWMDEDFDTGNILAQQDGIPLPDDISWSAYCAHAMPVIHDLLTRSLHLASAGSLGLPQDQESATYAGFMEPEFALIDWTKPAGQIHNQVRTHRYMRSTEHPVGKVGDEWIHVTRTSLQPAQGLRIMCGDNKPVWVTEYEPTLPPDGSS